MEYKEFEATWNALKGPLIRCLSKCEKGATSQQRTMQPRTEQFPLHLSKPAIYLSLVQPINSAHPPTSCSVQVQFPGDDEPATLSLRDQEVPEEGSDAAVWARRVWDLRFEKVSSQKQVYANKKVKGNSVGEEGRLRFERRSPEVSLVCRSEGRLLVVWKNLLFLNLINVVRS
jgi:hypothetical protein